LTCLALDYQTAGRFQDALQIHQQVYESRFRILGPLHPYTLDSLHHLGSSYIELKNPSKAVQILEELCEVKRKVLGHDNPDTLASMRNLGVAYHRSKNFIQSLKIFEQLLPMYEKVHGKTYSGTYRLMVNLGVNYGDQGRYEDAIRLLKQTYLSSLRYPAVRRLAFRNLFFIYLRAGNRIEAKALVLDNLQVARKWSEPESKQLAFDLVESGGMLLDLREWSEPVSLLHEALAILQKPPIHSPNILIVKSMLGSALLGQASTVTDPEKKAKLLSEAETLLHQSFETFLLHQPVPPPAQKRTTKTIESLIQLYTETNKPEEVKRWQAEKARRRLER
jgi:tetratricopeptide (TPR) repeat protein